MLLDPARAFALALPRTVASLALGVLGLVAVPSSASAQEESPEATTEEAPAAREGSEYQRHGFTMELGLGMSRTGTRSEVDGRDHSAFGLAPLSLGLGGFLTPHLALIGRAAGTSYFREDPRGTSYQTVSGFYGPTLQYWPTERLFVGGGVGLAVLAADLYKDASKDVRFLETGFGLNARAGWAFLLPGTHHAFTLSVDAFGSRFDKSNTLATAMNLGWQFF